MCDFVNTNFCRLCLNITDTQQTADLLFGDKQLCEILENLFPGLKLELVQNPKLCLACADKLRFAYVFKNTVVCNEQKIKSNNNGFVEIVNACILCLKQKRGNSFVFLYDNNCSYSYQLIRNVTEIATIQFDFDILDKPVICTECWFVVKNIYSFKKHCFRTEEKLRSLCEEKGLTSLSIQEVLSIIVKEKSVLGIPNKIVKEPVIDETESSHKLSAQNESKTDGRKDSKLITLKESIPVINLDSDNSDCDQLRDDKSETQTLIRINDSSLINNSDSNITESQSQIQNKNENSDSECSEYIFDETVNNDVVEIQIKRPKKIHDRNKIVKKNPEIISDVVDNDNSNIISEGVKEEIIKEEILIEYHGIDYSELSDFKDETSSDKWEKSSVTPKRRKTNHSEIKIKRNCAKRIKCGECNFVTSTKEIMTNHMKKHILYSETGNKCPTCQDVYQNPDVLEEHVQGCKGGLSKTRPSRQLSKAKQSKTCRECNFTTHLPHIYGSHMLLHTRKEKVDNVGKGQKAKTNKTTISKAEETVGVSSLEESESSRNIASVVYQCSYCSYKSMSHSKYVFHLKNVHDRKFVCDECQKGFKSRSALCFHIKKTQHR